MTYSDIQMVEAYSKLLEGLSFQIKIGLIDRLLKLLKKEKISKEESFFSSFGAFSDEKSAEEIIDDIKASRKFREREIEF